MELQYFGGNCVRITNKKANIVVDDNLQELGLKSITKPGEIALHTFSMPVAGPEVKLLIDQPGEYEVSFISINGVAARAHMDEEGKKSATMFKLLLDDLRVVILGHVYPELDDDQLEALGMVDVLIIPVGGFGYTLDAIGALKLIKKIEPKIIIPTHYADPAVKYPMPQAELTEVIKGLAMEPKETVSKLKIKGGELSELTQLIVLERS